jgi:hypothetical protein
MKVYSKLVWDKDFNVIEELSSEYEGPVTQMMCSPPPPPPPPPPAPAPAPAPAPTGPGRARFTGQTRQAAARGRGVLITQRQGALGVQDEELGAAPQRRSLLQPAIQTAQNVIRLIGGGY